MVVNGQIINTIKVIWSHWSFYLLLTILTKWKKEKEAQNVTYFYLLSLVDIILAVKMLESNVELQLQQTAMLLTNLLRWQQCDKTALHDTWGGASRYEQELLVSCRQWRWTFGQTRSWRGWDGEGWRPNTIAPKENEIPWQNFSLFCDLFSLSLSFLAYKQYLPAQSLPPSYTHCLPFFSFHTHCLTLLTLYLSHSL